MGYFQTDRIYRTWQAVTPSDVTSLALGVNGIYVGGAGNLSLTDQSGNTVVFAVTAGQTVHFGPLRVNATGTTATGIVALY